MFVYNATVAHHWSSLGNKHHCGTCLFFLFLSEEALRKSLLASRLELQLFVASSLLLLLLLCLQRMAVHIPSLSGNNVHFVDILRLHLRPRVRFASPLHQGCAVDVNVPTMA